MMIKQFLIIIGFATILCWGAWGVVLWNIDPTKASFVHMSFFYASFFFAFSGTIATILYGWYHFFGDVQVPVFRYVKKSMKQGVGTSFLVTALLFLQGIQVLNLWTVALIVLCIAFITSLKFSKKHSRSI